jgi:ADP-ribosylglycohydrolase
MGLLQRRGTFARGIVAYAAGDALGVPWEGSTPEEVRWEVLEALPVRGDWPRGATSDDTEQLLLVAEYLVDANGQIDERAFLGRLAKALPRHAGGWPDQPGSGATLCGDGGAAGCRGQQHRRGHAGPAVRLGNPGRRRPGVAGS